MEGREQGREGAHPVERPYKYSASWQGLLPTTVWAPEVGLTQDRRQRGEAENR